MASSSSSKIEIDTRDMVLYESFNLVINDGGCSNIQLEIKIDKTNNKVILTDYSSLVSIIKSITYNLITNNEIYDLPQIKELTSESLLEFIESKIQLNNTLKDSWRHKAIIALFKSITSEILLEKCRTVQIECATKQIIKIKDSCLRYPSNFLNHIHQLIELKEHFPHIDLSFLKDERILEEKQKIDQIYLSIP